MVWVGGTHWELALASGWGAKDDPECLSVTRSNESAFQLSGAVKEKDVISLIEIRDFYSVQVPSGAPFDEVVFGSFRGYCTRYLDDGMHWRKFWLCHGGLLVFATYVGTAESWAMEREDVYTMLHSLRIRGVGIAQ